MTDKINPNRIDPSLLAPIAGQGVRAANTQPAGKAFGQILAEQIGQHGEPVAERGGIGAGRGLVPGAGG